MKTEYQTQNFMHKPIFETTLEITIGLLTMISVHLFHGQNSPEWHLGSINIDSIINSIACFSGSFAYTRLFMEDKKMNNTQALVSAIVGYTFGVYSAGAWCEWKEVELLSSMARFWYLIGGFLSMLVMVIIYDFGKGLRKKAYAAGEKLGDYLSKKIK
jgi:hypothetical protein